MVASYEGRLSVGTTLRDPFRSFVDVGEVLPVIGEGNDADRVIPQSQSCLIHCLCSMKDQGKDYDPA